MRTEIIKGALENYLDTHTIIDRLNDDIMGQEIELTDEEQNLMFDAVEEFQKGVDLDYTFSSITE